MTQDRSNLPEGKEANDLFNNVAALIEQSKRQVALTVNREVTLLYWHVGKAINHKLLQEQRGEYGEQVVESLSSQLTKTYGKGWSKRHLWHCVRVADTFQEDQIVNALSTQLSWTHLRILAMFEDELKREFYTALCVQERWSTRVLQERIDSMLFERSALSKKPEDLLRRELSTLKSAGAVTPDLVFRDPYVLDFLGLSDTYSERDLESSILTQLQQFIIELGSDFAFLARQKRIIIDNEDFKIDLLFYHRGLKRLVAIDLKLGRFKAAYKGQMELYLKWLDKYERKEGEESPIGLILCAEKSQEQIELLELNKGHIRVSEYLTQLPPKEVFASRLHKAIELAKVKKEE
ncbi:YhcG family protein [Pontibacter silvestris]|uniref:YhcG family protein n=1 Tax=Pontibacter silvestris TaxID=2305183 RepID=A0ABW4X473_9BACT|nr:PDDEXK nuclease domain-containing protein [Pontibacter silvestris]MCC9138797.1 PDDEXK nuclease domain-containing protein [Pontibacter silvestris]